MMKSTAALLCVLPALASLVAAQPRPGLTVNWSKVDQRITWFGTWKAGIAAAKATGRPILLVSAAPHCRSISGVW